ncbi:4971_t:CDS:2, partial [Dentiscutata heterogama]
NIGMGCAFSKSRGKANSMDSQNSQTEFRYIDGRRFHNVKNAVYQVPNDDDEIDRLHLQHFIMRYVWQSNFSAPIEHILSKPGAKILDIGYPLVKVIGLDISPHQPTQIKPKNFEFVKANAQERLPFGDNTFDFVFQRFLVAGYAKEKWPYVINEIVRVLKPGGFLELYEPSKMIDGGPVTQRLWNGQRGGDWDIYLKLEKYLQSQGQVKNIKKEMKKCYFGVNHNNIELSKALVNNMVTAYVSLKPVLKERMQISDEEYDKLTKISKKELLELDAYILHLPFVTLVYYDQFEKPHKKLDGTLAIPYTLDNIKDFRNIEEEILSCTLPKQWEKIELGHICYQLSNTSKADQYDLKADGAIIAFVIEAKYKKIFSYVFIRNIKMIELIKEFPDIINKLNIIKEKIYKNLPSCDIHIQGCLISDDGQYLKLDSDIVTIWALDSTTISAVDSTFISGINLISISTKSKLYSATIHTRKKSPFKTNIHITNNMIF